MAWYVYNLVDPRSGEIFYIGKGCNDRVDSHEREAKGKSTHAKCDVIRAIWAEGLQVQKVKVCSFKDEQAAYDFEAAEIARIGLHNLTNIQEGGGSPRSGNAPVETIHAARLLIKYVAAALHTMSKSKLSAPWQDVVENMIPHTCKRLALKYGQEFMQAEFAKHQISAVFV